MNIHIHHHDKDAFRLLSMVNTNLLIIIKNQKNMADELSTLQEVVTELSAKATTLQTTVDAHQASDAAVVAGLKDTITKLEAQTATGATPEQLTAIKDQLVSISGNITATVADVANTAVDGTVTPV
jgi:hypothetical protein